MSLKSDDSACLLGLDYGDKRVGLALAKGGFVEALKPLSNSERLLEELRCLCEREGVEGIVLGLPEPPQRKKVTRFLGRLRTGLGLPVVMWDEVLTTKQAFNRALSLGIGRKRRRHVDSAAAALLLEEYLAFQKGDS